MQWSLVCVHLFCYTCLQLLWLLSSSRLGYDVVVTAVVALAKSAVHQSITLSSILFQLQQGRHSGYSSCTVLNVPSQHCIITTAAAATTTLLLQPFFHYPVLMVAVSCARLLRGPHGKPINWDCWGTLTRLMPFPTQPTTLSRVLKLVILFTGVWAKHFTAAGLVAVSWRTLAVKADWTLAR